MRYDDQTPDWMRQKAGQRLSRLDWAVQELAKLVRGDVLICQDQTPIRAVRKTVDGVRRKLSIQDALGGLGGDDFHFFIRFDIRKSVPEGWYSWVKLEHLQMPLLYDDQLAALTRCWGRLENVADDELEFHQRSATGMVNTHVRTSVVHVTAWENGFNKAGLQKLLQSRNTEFDEVKAKKVIAGLLKGTPFILFVPSAAEAEQLRSEINALKAVCFVVNESGSVTPAPSAQFK